MPAKKPGNSVRLWISNEDLEHLKALSEVTEVTQTELMTKILHSGIKAIVENNYRLMLPLTFKMVDGHGESAHRVTRPISKPLK